MTTVACMRTLDQLASDQYGHLSHGQLREVLSGYMIRRRRSRGLYVTVHRCVIRLASHAETEFGRYAAALLAVGRDAVLDGRAAARAHGLTALQPLRTVEVVVPYRRVPRVIAGVRIRRSRRWDQLGATQANRLAVPSLAATAARLAPAVGQGLLTDVVQDMVRRGLDLADLIPFAGDQAGGPALRRVLDALDVSRKSALERILFPALVAAGLDSFTRHALVRDGKGDVIEEVDALFREARVAVQADGWAFHHDRSRFQRDRTNQNRLSVETGLLVLRFTHRDLTERLPDVVTQIHQAVEGAAV
jgi:very-short-patch-repair endonuclease